MTVIKWKRIEAGYYEATDGEEQIVKRPFTGWKDDATMPWVVFYDGRVTYSNRGPAFVTLAEAKEAVEARRTAAAAPTVPREKWGVATMDDGLLDWYSKKAEALAYVASLGGNLTFSISTEDFVEVHSGYPGEERISTHWLGTAEGLKREGIEIPT